MSILTTCAHVYCEFAEPVKMKGIWMNLSCSYFLLAGKGILSERVSLLWTAFVNLTELKDVLGNLCVYICCK